MMKEHDSEKGREFRATAVSPPAKISIAGEASQKEAHAEPPGTVFTSPSMHFPTTPG